MKLSYSKISRFLSCPKSYQYRYIKGLKDADNFYGHFGRLIHRVLYIYLEEEEMSGEPDLGLLTEILEEEFDLDPKHYPEALSCLQGFRDIGNVYLDRVIGLEEPFHLRIEGHSIRGYWDRVENFANILRISDYKTSRQLLNNDQLKTHLQADLYNLSARERYDYHGKIKISFDQLQFGVRQTTTRTERDAETTRSFLRSIVKRIEESDFKASVSSYCGLCGFSSLCSEYSNSSADFNFSDLHTNLEGLLDQREETMGILSALTQRKNSINSEIKARLSENPRLSTDTWKLSMSPIRNVSYRFEEVVDLLVAYSGLPREDVIQEVCNLVNSKVEKFARQTAFHLSQKNSKKLTRALAKLKITRKGSPRLTIKKR